jgi:hypothetical protein
MIQFADGVPVEMPPVKTPRKKMTPEMYNKLSLIILEEISFCPLLDQQIYRDIKSIIDENYKKGML